MHIFGSKARLALLTKTSVEMTRRAQLCERVPHSKQSDDRLVLAARPRGVVDDSVGMQGSRCRIGVCLRIASAMLIIFPTSELLFIRGFLWTRFCLNLPFQVAAGLWTIIPWIL